MAILVGQFSLTIKVLAAAGSYSATSVPLDLLQHFGGWNQHSLLNYHGKRLVWWLLPISLRDSVHGRSWGWSGQPGRGEGGREAGAEQGKTEQRWGDERGWVGREEFKTRRKGTGTRRKPRSRNWDGKMDLMEGGRLGKRKKPHLLQKLGGTGWIRHWSTGN